MIMITKTRKITKIMSDSADNKDPANWRSRSATACVFYLCSKYCVPARNFCVDVECMVCFHVFGCVLSVCQMSSYCVFTLSLRCYRANSELKMVLNQHIVNTKKSWTQASTNLLGKRKRSLVFVRGIKRWISLIDASSWINWIRGRCRITWYTWQI